LRHDSRPDENVGGVIGQERLIEVLARHAGHAANRSYDRAVRGGSTLCPWTAACDLRARPWR
jgi:hypothetical protein